MLVPYILSEFLNCISYVQLNEGQLQIKSWEFCEGM
jgi:hypothetical protein